jgi:hypothetical protein
VSVPWRSMRRILHASELGRRAIHNSRCSNWERSLQAACFLQFHRPPDWTTSSANRVTTETSYIPSKWILLPGTSRELHSLLTAVGFRAFPLPPPMASNLRRRKAASSFPENCDVVTVAKPGHSGRSIVTYLPCRITLSMRTRARNKSKRARNMA